MWFTVELFLGRPADKWVTHTDGHFELAPQPPEEEYEYEEENRFGFR